MTPLVLMNLLGRFRFDLSSEEDLKKQMASALLSNGIDFKREFSLSKSDRPDFMVGSIAIEVKIKGRPKDIYRQCERYCKYDGVSDLLLVTNKAIGFPQSLNGKPSYVLKLGKAWL